MSADKTAVPLDLHLVHKTVVTMAVETVEMWVVLTVVLMVVSMADMTVVH